MIVSEFFHSVRFDLGDQHKASYSDYDLLDALNSILKIVNNSLIKLKSNLIVRDATLTVANGVADLPVDFISPIYINSTTEELSPAKPLDQGGYLIIGDTIHAQDGVITMIYRQAFPQVGLTDDLPVPDWFTELLKKFLVIIVKKEMSKTDSAFQSRVESDISSILSGREYHNIERLPEFSL